MSIRIYARTYILKNAWIVADEMQNSTISQMKMLLTRIGENTKLVITGDLEQNDLKDKNGLEDFLDKMKGKRSNSINSVEFNNEDIEREDVVKEVLDLYQTNTHPYLNSDSNETSINSSLGELKKSSSNNDLKSENSDVSTLSEGSQGNSETPETNDV